MDENKSNEYTRSALHIVQLNYLFVIYILDSNPPEIIDCPNTIYKYTDRNSRTALVWWKKPIATDNSNNVTVHQTKGPANGTLFRVGFTEIQYQATDSAGNKSPFCTFFVAVEGEYEIQNVNHRPFGINIFRFLLGPCSFM